MRKDSSAPRGIISTRDSTRKDGYSPAASATKAFCVTIHSSSMSASTRAPPTCAPSAERDLAAQAFRDTSRCTEGRRIISARPAGSPSYLPGSFCSTPALTRASCRTPALSAGRVSPARATWPSTCAHTQESVRTCARSVPRDSSLWTAWRDTRSATTESNRSSVRAARESSPSRGIWKDIWQHINTIHDVHQNVFICIWSLQLLIPGSWENTKY